MKKKLMIVAVLLGAMSLGACVDDNESASVTAVRTAKAEQLKSIAAMNNAEASAKAILAAADAALKNAQAEAEKAKAAYDNAQAEIAKKQIELIELQKAEQTIENQKKQAELEQQLSNLEVTKKANEQKLAQIAANMKQAETETQAALLRSQLALKQAEQELLDYDKQLAEAATQAEKDKLLQERQELQNLASTYSITVNNLISAQSMLSMYKQNLVYVEANLVTMEESKKQAIIDNNNTISLNEMKIAKYKLYANYTQDLTTLSNKISELDAEQERLWDEYIVANNAFYAMNVDVEASTKATNDIQKDKFYQFAVNCQYMDADGNLQPIEFCIGQYLPASYYTRSGKWYSYKGEEYTQLRTFGDSIGVDFPKSSDFVTDIRVVENAVNDYIDMVNGWSTSNKEQLKLYQAVYNGKATKDMYDSNLEAVACRNAVDSTAYLKTAYNAATDATEKADLYQRYKNALDKETFWKNQIDNYTNRLADNDVLISRVKDQWDMYQKFDANKLVLQAKMDKRNEQNVEEYKSKVAAWIVSMDKSEAYNACYTELTAAQTIYYGNNGDKGASELASDIKDLEEENARLKKDNEDISNITSQQETIAGWKNRITAQEAVVKAKEVAVANAKADLDAAMPKE
ncbi:hypothetical protein [Bacteroides helcogenes]|nr:hypothetical protein [Bacteroides helcogenes]MDY5239409.1 hypothetical protein [Bacteroides helcogenes]